MLLPGRRGNPADPSRHTVAVKRYRLVFHPLGKDAGAGPGEVGSIYRPALEVQPMAKQSADVTARDRSGVRQRVRHGIESGKEKYTGSSAEYLFAKALNCSGQGNSAQYEDDPGETGDGVGRGR